MSMHEDLYLVCGNKCLVPYFVDTSLTVGGSPADANAVGEAIEEVETALSGCRKTTDIIPVSDGGTGATVKEQAIKNLSGLYLDVIASSDNIIPSNSDLNNYKTAGVYRAISADITKTLTNAPTMYTNAGFRLIVSATSTASLNTGCIQIAIYNTTYTLIAIRVMESNSWSTWSFLGKNVLTSYDYGTSLPAAGTKGRIFYKKV